MNQLKARIYGKFRTQFDLAKSAEISEGRLSRIIHGRTIPTEQERQKIATLLDLAVGELFPEQNPTLQKSA